MNHVEVENCRKKRQYHSVTMGLNAAELISFVTQTRFMLYRCPCCNEFHLTRKTEKQSHGAFEPILCVDARGAKSESPAVEHPGDRAHPAPEAPALLTAYAVKEPT